MQHPKSPKRRFFLRLVCDDGTVVYEDVDIELDGEHVRGLYHDVSTSKERDPSPNAVTVHFALYDVDSESYTKIKNIRDVPADIFRTRPAVPVTKKRKNDDTTARKKRKIDDGMLHVLSTSDQVVATIRYERLSGDLNVNAVDDPLLLEYARYKRGFTELRAASETAKRIKEDLDNYLEELKSRKQELLNFKEELDELIEECEPCIKQFAEAQSVVSKWKSVVIDARRSIKSLSS